MNFDRLLTISTGKSRHSTHWQNQTLRWSELIQKLQIPVRGSERVAEYDRLSKPKRDELKDVGGFVGGALVGPRRKASSVKTRELVTLDLDNVPVGGTDDVLRKVAGLGCAYCVYSTRSHRPEAPRLRVVLPTDKPISADEYEPLARQLAKIAGLIDYADPTTFEASRLMYWASVSMDGVYIHHFEDKPFLDAQGVLDGFDWQNINSWPMVPGEGEKTARRAATQKDPTEKAGIVGVFCRVYDIPDVIDTYLSEQYEAVPGYDGRYTYTEGSTVGGAVVYDDGRFLYSHHATDPASNTLCNAFDLVRLHYFETEDDQAKPGTPAHRLPSYQAMCALAVKDAKVAKLKAEERYKQAAEAFGDAPDAVLESGNSEDDDWMEQLELSKQTGNPTKTIRNIWIILQNDPHLKGKLAFDEFSNRGLAMGSLPWNAEEGTRDWSDPDDSGLRQYLETVYGLAAKDKVNDAVLNVAMSNRFNDVKSYLDSLEWDGTPRLDRLLIDYFGAEDHPYTKAVMRKFLCAAVARVYHPGVKFDCMPILAGPQGCGKSTFLARLGGRWYTDSLDTFEGKDAAEIIQGQLIIEVGELQAMNRSEVNQIKQFLSRTDDVYRVPYGRRTARYPRRCVFAGTTNETEFLRDSTGNRRFWPVDLYPHNATKNIFREFDGDEVRQVWAEAVVLWRLGEPLYLDAELEAHAELQQGAHMEMSPKEGIVREFLAKPIPFNWDELDIKAKRIFLENGPVPGEKLTFRDKVCAAAVWCECFRQDIRGLSWRDSKEINDILSKINGWRKDENPKSFGKDYGRQRAFVMSDELRSKKLEESKQ